MRYECACVCGVEDSLEQEDRYDRLKCIFTRIMAGHVNEDERR